VQGNCVVPKVPRGSRVRDRK